MPPVSSHRSRIQVTRISAHIQARAYGCSIVSPQSEAIYGVTQQVAPFTGSAITEFMYDYAPAIPTTNTAPSTATNTHKCPALELRGQQQIRNFTQTGVVQQYCVGVCQSAVCPTEVGEAPLAATGPRSTATLTYRASDVARGLEALRAYVNGQQEKGTV